MKEDINLLPRHKDTKKGMNFLLMGSFALFILLFFTAASLVFYTYALSSTSSTLTADIESLNAKISSVSAAKNKLLVASERLLAIQKITLSRQTIDRNLNTSLSIIPTSFSVDEISAKDDFVSLNVSSPDLASFNTLIEQDLPALAKDKKIGVSKIDISSFSQRNQTYLLALNFYYKAKVGQGK